MEKRQLDYNAPLLSARKFSSPRNSSELVHRKVLEKRPPPGRDEFLPLNKTDWESEDITKPAAVPFHWEQTPGRPKNEAQTRFPTRHEPSNTPRLPPGRVYSGETPRLPPKRLSGPSKYNSGERSYDHNISFSDHASLLEKLDESLKCQDEPNLESEEDDDTYSDALNTLSLTETCSVSGISGGYHNSGTFCVDKQTRDFMMNRFLPAAKAVVLETPQYAAKKATVVSEEVMEVKKVVSGERIKHLTRKNSSDAILPYYRQGFGNVESEDELDKECSVPVKKSGKSWGILPRICVKSSLCLLNPLPAMKSKSRPPTPSAGEERRLRRNAVSGPLDKNGCQVPPKKKYHSGLLSRDLPGFENKSTNYSYPLLNSRESPRSGVVSPLRRYRSGSVSPYRNESPKSAFREGSAFLGVPKEVGSLNASKIASSRKMFKALQDVSRTQKNNEGGSSGPAVGPVEKTVYVDSINTTVAPSSKNYAVKSDKMAQGKKTSSKYADEVRDIKLYLSVDRESRAVKCDEVGSDVKTNEERRLGLLDNGGECDLPLKSPLPPPLPKSPSESWLWRTFLSIPLGNPFAHSLRNSQLRSKKQGRKDSDADIKWETIVKSSKVQHDHARYSEELIPHASHRKSKS